MTWRGSRNGGVGFWLKIEVKLGFWFFDDFYRRSDGAFAFFRQKKLAKMPSAQRRRTCSEFGGVAWVG